MTLPDAEVTLTDLPRVTIRKSLPNAAGGRDDGEGNSTVQIEHGIRQSSPYDFIHRKKKISCELTSYEDLTSDFIPHDIHSLAKLCVIVHIYIYICLLVQKP